eukprot:3442925-Prymnesium_polylepis.2
MVRTRLASQAQSASLPATTRSLRDESTRCGAPPSTSSRAVSSPSPPSPPEKKRGGLSHNHDTARQEALSWRAVHVAEAAVDQKRLPLAPAQIWARLPGALSVIDHCKEPPTIGHTKRELRERHRLNVVIDHDRAAGTQQPVAVVQRVPHEGRCVKTVGRDDDIMLCKRKPLQARVGVDVEQLRVEHRVLGKSNTCLAEEGIRHVREDVPRASALDDGQDGRCRATASSPDLEHHHTPLCGKQPQDCFDRDLDAGVEEKTDHRILIHRQHGLHGTTRKEQLLVGHRRRQGITKVRPALLGELSFRPHVGTRFIQLRLPLLLVRGATHAAEQPAGQRTLQRATSTPRIKQLVVPDGYFRLGHL